MAQKSFANVTRLETPFHQESYQLFLGYCLKPNKNWSFIWIICPRRGSKWFKYITLPPIIMEVKNGCISNRIVSLHLEWFFHFHDCGRKGIDALGIAPQKSSRLQSDPVIPSWSSFLPKKTWIPNPKAHFSDKFSRSAKQLEP